MNGDTTSSNSTVQLVLTAKSAPVSQEFDLSALTVADLDILKEVDPFMYSSIPSVAEARRLGRLVNHSELILSLRGVGSEKPNSHVVRRRTRISDECIDVSMLMKSDENFNMNGDTTALVPTAKSDPVTQEFDLSALTVADLDILKKIDPFMYSSIPCVAEARRLGRPVNHSQLILSLRGVGSEKPNSHVVRRHTRISDDCIDVSMHMKSDEQEQTVDCGQSLRRFSSTAA